MESVFNPLIGAGKIRAMLRERDWSAFAPGHPGTWPASLITGLQFMLDSGQAASLMCGPDLNLFYNDAYAKLLGEKHPQALGRPLWVAWPEIREGLEPDIEQARQGHPVFSPNTFYRVRRNGRLQTAWFTYSLLPIRDEQGNVIGILNQVTETTAAMENERRQAFLLELSDRLQPLATADEIIATASELLGRHLEVLSVVYSEIDHRQGSVLARHIWSRRPIPVAAREVLRLADFGMAVIERLRQDNVVRVDDVTRDPRTSAHADTYARLEVVAVLAVTLRKGQRMTVLSLQDDVPHAWTDYEVQLARDMAERTWSALESTRAQAALVDERDRTQYILDNMTEGFGLLDRDWKIMQINAEGLRITGRQGTEVVGRNCWEVFPEIVGTEVEALYQRVRATGIAGTLELCHPTSPAGDKCIEVRVYPSLDDGLAVFFRDITERKRAERQIQEASQHDSLTGLPNRSLLHGYCAHLLAMAARTGDQGAVLFIDLDRFKPINDLYGHEVGDRVLQEVARRLQSCTRKQDIVGRLGGDEFLIVLARLDSTEQPAVVAQHVLDAVSRPILVGPLQLNVSPSIGISLFPAHAYELDLLIRCADLAMYEAKKAGRDTYRVYAPGLDEKATGLVQLEHLLKQSLEHDSITLFYQPILDSHSRELMGAEALMRIPDEDGTLLSPAEFIPVAETAGIIDRLGRWVIREACRQHHAWRAAGLPAFPIAVNISPLQFRQPAFVHILESAIREFAIDPCCIQIEVTESAVMDNVPETVETLNRLQAMGISIALDDFGTGYSSLSHLSYLPLNKLKIDQSFVQNMRSNSNCRSITEAIIGLGRTLDLKVVGEGIESEAAMELLRDYGCDQVQGFLFSRPLPAAEFEHWYRSNKLH